MCLHLDTIMSLENLFNNIAHFLKYVLHFLTKAIYTGLNFTSFNFPYLFFSLLLFQMTKYIKMYVYAHELKWIKKFLRVRKGKYAYLFFSHPLTYQVLKITFYT